MMCILLYVICVYYGLYDVLATILTAMSVMVQALDLLTGRCIIVRQQHRL